jgi:hypothetical protein
VEAHHAHADRAFARCRILGAGHFVGRAVDEVLKHVVEETQHVFDKALVALPFVPGFQVERREAADRRAVVAQMVDAGGQGDFRAQVRGRDLEAQFTMMRGHHAVHRVVEDDIGLARGEAHFDQLLEQRARIELVAHRAVLGAAQGKFGAVAHGFHEFVGQQHAVVQVEGLAVEVARRLADFEELLDLGVRDVEVAGRRATAQRALADRQRQAVHHAHERNDAAGLAVEADVLADPAHIAPVRANAAPARGEPDVLVPGLDDAFEAVLDRVEVARDRQAPSGAPVRENRRCGHEPEVRDIVIETLGMGRIVGIGVGHAGKQILIGLAGQQIAVVEGFLAERGQLGIARGVGADREAAGIDRLGIERLGSRGALASSAAEAAAARSAAAASTAAVAALFGPALFGAALAALVAFLVEGAFSGALSSAIMVVPFSAA